MVIATVGAMGLAVGIIDNIHVLCFYVYTYLHRIDHTPLDSTGPLEF